MRIIHDTGYFKTSQSVERTVLIELTPDEGNSPVFKKLRALFKRDTYNAQSKVRVEVYSTVLDEWHELASINGEHPSMRSLPKPSCDITTTKVLYEFDAVLDEAIEQAKLVLL